ncbi:hypothetical protein ABID25_006477 [Mesorhizobium abyssinicae]
MRRLWCAVLRHVRSIFASRKLTFVDLLAAICLLVNGAKGMSAVQFSRDLDVQYKTAFVLAHKLREALTAETKNETLEGEVEIDGAYFGGVVRPENRVEDRKDRRVKANQSDRRRVVIALRERWPHPHFSFATAKPKASKSPALVCWPVPSCSRTRPPIGMC